MGSHRAEIDPPTQLTSAEKIRENLIVAEFTSLRTEILQRIQFQHLTIGLALTFAGALLTYASSAKETVSADILWGYPVLTLGLAVMWSFDNMRIVQISEYIKSDIEKLLAGMGPSGWQDFLGSKRCHTLLNNCGLTGVTAAMAIFFFAPLIVVLACIWAQNQGGNQWNDRDWTLLRLDLGIILLTVLLLAFSNCGPSDRKSKGTSGLPTS